MRSGFDLAAMSNWRVCSDGTSTLAHLPYGGEGVLVRPIDPDQATGLFAGRYRPERHRDAEGE